MGRIFVQIAAYRDRELPFTIADLLAKAHFPRELRIGVCNQGTAEDWSHPVLKDRRVRQWKIPYTQSEGVCWARSRVQEFYDGEEFTLQLDSHHRFEPGWDRTLLRMLESLGSAKPLLSGYLPPYDGAGAKARVRPIMPGKQVFKSFDYDGVVHFIAHGLEKDEQFSAPRGRFVSGHFIFTRGAFVEEVPYDPAIYFSGEEITLAVRAYTHGYDLFHPHEPVAYHAYGRDAQRRHWDDHNAESGEAVARVWNDFQNRSVERIATLLTGGRVPKRFGFGKARTLRDYEIFAGIDFVHRCVHANTLAGLEPPSSRCWNWEDGDALCSEHDAKVRLDTKTLTPDRRSDSWYFGLHDARGMELLRIDITDPDLLLGRKRTLRVHFWSTRPPASYTLIPHRKTGRWGRSLVRKLNTKNYREPHVS